MISAVHGVGCSDTGAQLLHSGKRLSEGISNALSLVVQYLSGQPSGVQAPPAHWTALLSRLRPDELAGWARSSFTRYTEASRGGPDTVRSRKHIASRKISLFLQIEVDMPGGGTRLHLAEVQYFLRAMYPLALGPGQPVPRPLRLAVCAIFRATIVDRLIRIDYPVTSHGRWVPVLSSLRARNNFVATLVKHKGKPQLFAWEAYSRSHMEFSEAP